MGFYIKCFEKKNIVLNGKKATGNEKLNCGDTVKFFLSDETIDKFSGNQKTSAPYENMPDLALPVLYEDDHVLIFHKPAGLLSQKSKPEDLSVAEYVIYYMLQTGSLKKGKSLPPSSLPSVTVWIETQAVSLPPEKVLPDFRN